MKTHVHIYHVMSKAEVDIDAESDVIAATMAIGRAESGKANFRKSDCNFIAVVPEVSPIKTPAKKTKVKQAAPKKSLASGQRKGVWPKIPSKAARTYTKSTGQKPKQQ